MSDYTGRHRPPTRAERRALEHRSRLPKSLSPAYALPTAAAVTLALTAVGATAAQSSSFPGSTAPQAQTAQAALSANALLDDPQLAKSARTEVAAAAQDSAGLSERRRAVSASVAERQGRAQEKASRDKKRKAIAKAEREAAPTWVRPLANAPLTSGYGLRWGRLHAGVDYGAPVGTPLRSMGTGKVVGAGPMSGYGVYIDIEYTDGTVSRYGHLSSISSSVGQQVGPGDVVGYTGNTGRSTGPHLHLEIRPGGGAPINPAGWLAERGIS